MATRFPQYSDMAPNASGIHEMDHQRIIVCFKQQWGGDRIAIRNKHYHIMCVDLNLSKIIIVSHIVN